VGEDDELATCFEETQVLIDIGSRQNLAERRNVAAVPNRREPRDKRRPVPPSGLCLCWVADRIGDALWSVRKDLRSHPVPAVDLLRPGGSGSVAPDPGNAVFRTLTSHRFGWTDSMLIL
jgi:hypothetical protein